MQLDRKLQANILRTLEEVYPDSLLVEALPDYSNNRSYMANLFYLQEHGLIEGGDIREPGQCRSMIDVQITKTGLDFLSDDGGLQAILGNFAVKFQRDELVDALQQVILANTPEDEHNPYLHQLEQLNSQQLKDFVLVFLQTKESKRIKIISEILESGK